LSPNFILAEKDNSQIVPSRQKKNVNETAEFECFSKGNVRWYHRSSFHNILSRDQRLIIPRVEITKGGDYFCYGTYTNKPKKFLAAAILQVYG